MSEHQNCSADIDEPEIWRLISQDVKERIAEGDGFWRSCSGCFETSDGYNVNGYPHSAVFGCELGSGCGECGGIGAVWDNLDYSRVGEDAGASAPAQTAPVNAAALTERLIEAAVSYEHAEGIYSRPARQELSEARAAVEAAIGLRAATIEECAKLIEPKQPRPCDCDRCDCGNRGDAEAVAAWDADAYNAKAIRALAAQPPAAPVETGDNCACGGGDVSGHDAMCPDRLSAGTVDLEAVKRWFNSLPGESLSRTHWLALVALLNEPQTSSMREGGK